MPLLILPNELLLVIGEGLGTRRDLNALSRTNVRLYHLFNGELYSKIPVEGRNVVYFWAATMGMPVLHSSYSTTGLMLKAFVFRQNTQEQPPSR
jgi:hypothetical protein